MFLKLSKHIADLIEDVHMDFVEAGINFDNNGLLNLVTLGNFFCIAGHGVYVIHSSFSF